MLLCFYGRWTSADRLLVHMGIVGAVVSVLILQALLDASIIDCGYPNHASKDL